MSISVWTVREGEALQIGDAAVVRVEEKSGRRVRLVIATLMSPIHLIPSGIFPDRFTTGITGEPRRAPSAYAPTPQMASTG
jgi:hypothetical protein